MSQRKAPAPGTAATIGVCVRTCSCACVHGARAGRCPGPLVCEGRTPPEHTSRVRAPRVWLAQALGPQGRLQGGLPAQPSSMPHILQTGTGLREALALESRVGPHLSSATYQLCDV